MGVRDGVGDRDRKGGWVRVGLWVGGEGGLLELILRVRLFFGFIWGGECTPSLLGVDLLEAGKKVRVESGTEHTAIVVSH